MPDEPRAELLRTLPDIPRWLEARALLLSDHADLRGGPERWILRNEAPGGKLVVVIGRPDEALLREALADRPDAELVCLPELEEAVAALLPDFQSERAVLYRLADSTALAAPGPNIRLLLPEDSLAHLPADLRAEMEDVRTKGDVCAAFVAGGAASFAYAYWRTETLFDVSIDTAPEFRRRGLARRAVSELIRRERAFGREPIWGAFETNAASRALAAGLGFEPVDELVVFRTERSEQAD